MLFSGNGEVEMISRISASIPDFQTNGLELDSQKKMDL